MDVSVGAVGCVGALGSLGRCLVACAAIWLSACTSSHDVVGVGESLLAGSNARDAGASAAGRGGSAAAGRSGGGAGSAGSAGAGAGTCNSDCAGVSVLGLAELPPCCTADKQCGVDLSGLGLGGCGQQDAPGNVDPSCPLGFLGATGCCRADGTCGTIDALFGLGCVVDATATMVTPCTPL